MNRVLEILASEWHGDSVRLYGSGTHALQGALRLALNESVVPEPEVIVPAYGCPDLLTAVIGAGATPRLVDVNAKGWGYDLLALQRALGPRTRAVIAVNLLGVGDQADQLAPLLRDAKVWLVQDWAQHLPRQITRAWVGDAVVFSFGRGKPLNFLGGGALLLRRPANQGSSSSATRASLPGLVPAVLFNLLTTPWLYGLVSRTPGLGIGTTRYKSPTAMRELATSFAARILYGWTRYRDVGSYDTGRWRAALDRWAAAGLTRLVACDDQEPAVESLRLALLAPEGLRDRIVGVLRSRGLGASVLYGKELTQLPGVPLDIAAQGPFPNARRLAARLLTLPTHSDVRPADVAETVRLVCEVLAGKAA